MIRGRSSESCSAKGRARRKGTLDAGRSGGLLPPGALDMHLHRLDGSVERLGNVEVAQSGLPLVEAELLGLRQGRGGQIVPRIEQGDATAEVERRHGVQVCGLLRSFERSEVRGVGRE